MVSELCLVQRDTYLIVTVLSRIVDPSVAFDIPPDADAAAAALALVFDVVPVVPVPFFGRQSTGTVHSNKKNERSRIHDSYITRKQRPALRKGKR